MPPYDREKIITNHMGTPRPLGRRVETPTDGIAMLKWAFEGYAELEEVLGYFDSHIQAGSTPEEAYSRAFDNWLEVQRAKEQSYG